MDLNIPIKKHIWKIATIGLGIIISILIIHIMQFINFTLYPFEANISEFNQSVYGLFVRENPLFLAGLLLSNFAGSFFGGATARLTHPAVTTLSAGWVGLILMGLDLYNLLSVDYPLWFWLLTLVIYIPAAWSGAFAVSYIQTKHIED